MSIATQYDTNQLIEEFKINGFVVLEDFISSDVLDRIYEAWVPIRDREIERQADDPNRGTNRYAILIPNERPFVNPEIFEDPTLVKLIEKVLGDDYVCQNYNSNTPFPGSVYQRWHRDLPPIFPGLMTPTISVAIRIPLVDTTRGKWQY